jgi:hypothetical protein
MKMFQEIFCIICNNSFSNIVKLSLLFNIFIFNDETNISKKSNKKHLI